MARPDLPEALNSSARFRYFDASDRDLTDKSRAEPRNLQPEVKIRQLQPRLTATRKIKSHGAERYGAAMNGQTIYDMSMMSKVKRSGGKQERGAGLRWDQVSKALVATLEFK